MGELTALFKPPYWWPKNIIPTVSPSDLSRQNSILALWQLAQYSELSENVSPLAENFYLNFTGRTCTLNCDISLRRTYMYAVSSATV